MLQRFVAGTAIASIVVAVGTLALVLWPGVTVSPLTTIWCFIPFIWGMWATLTPNPWFPARLPLWGAILGAIAGSFAAFGLNVPLRVLGVALPVATRLLLVFAIVALYYVFWMAVRSVYAAVGTVPVSPKAIGAAGSK